jgi:hypothetical protein
MKHRDVPTSHEVPADDASLNAMGARQWPGYLGAFSRNQAPGAIPNGTRVAKVWCEAGDLEPIGTQGAVLGSLPVAAELPAHGDVRFCYWVEWDSRPRCAVFLIDKKIGRAP